MADPYIGEIRVVGFSFAPQGWATCNGQLLLVSDYQVLFSLIGTTYGGDGQITFGLPNLNSRLGIGSQNGVAGQGLTSYPLGSTAGTEGVQLTTNQLPVHAHGVAVPLRAATSGTATANPVGNFPAPSPSAKPYASAPTGATLNAQALTATVGVAGSSQAHANIQPVLAMNYIIALEGVFPPRQ